jgi:hypothetical protein
MWHTTRHQSALNLTRFIQFNFQLVLAIVPAMLPIPAGTSHASAREPAAAG